MSEKANLLIKTCFGFACESNSFKEKLISECIFITLIPELVEKKDPPIITNIKKINERLLGASFVDMPILDMLLVKESNREEKFELYLKNTKKINTKDIK